MAESLTYRELVAEGLAAEKSGETVEAIDLYQRAIKKSPSSETPYNRLMIIYRKSKEHARELAVIKQAILVFEKHYQQKRSNQPLISSKTKRISNALIKSLGLIDKRGKAIHVPEPLNKWQKRRAVVEKKMKTGRVKK